MCSWEKVGKKKRGTGDEGVEREKEGSRRQSILICFWFWSNFGLIEVLQRPYWEFLPIGPSCSFPHEHLTSPGVLVTAEKLALVPSVN